MPEHPDPADVRRRLAAGEWLRIGDLVVLFGESRSNVDRWLRNGVRIAGKRMVIRYREKPGGWREAHPGDVAAVLAEAEKVRSADDPKGTGEQ